MADSARNPNAVPLAERDFAALAHAQREPGPQRSKASPRAHRVCDFIAIAGAVLAVVAFLAGPVLALIGV